MKKLKTLTKLHLSRELDTLLYGDLTYRDQSVLQSMSEDFKKFSWEVSNTELSVEGRCEALVQAFKILTCLAIRDTQQLRNFSGTLTNHTVADHVSVFLWLKNFHDLINGLYSPKGLLADMRAAGKPLIIVDYNPSTRRIFTDSTKWLVRKNDDIRSCFDLRNSFEGGLHYHSEERLRLGSRYVTSFVRSLLNGDFTSPLASLGKRTIQGTTCLSMESPMLS